jgi:hypothetical protein
MSEAEEPPRDVNTRLLDERIDQALERRFPKGSGSGGGGDDFESRIATVERKVDDLRIALERMESKIDQLPKSADFFELKGRVSQLPTVWQQFGLIIAIFGLAFVLVRFGLPQI